MTDMLSQNQNRYIQRDLCLARSKLATAIEAIIVHCHKAVVPWGSESCRPRVGSTRSLREFFFITSVGSSAQESRVHSKMVLFEENFKFSAAASSLIPTVPSQSFLFSASGLERLVPGNVRCLDILARPLWHNYSIEFFFQLRYVSNAIFSFAFEEVPG